VKEAAFLVAMQRIVGGVEIEDDLVRGCLVRRQEQLDEQSLDRRRIMSDLVVARGFGWRMLEPVQGALAGERGAALTLGVELAGQRRQHRVVPQLVVVDQILIAERDAEHPLRHHRLDAVLDLRLGTAIDEAGGEPAHQPNRPVGRAQQQRPGIRGDLAAVESGHHPPALDHFITEQVAATLCRHRGTPLQRVKALSQKNFPTFRAPMHRSFVRNPG